MLRLHGIGRVFESRGGIRGDMIEAYKILTNKYDSRVNLYMEKQQDSITRGQGGVLSPYLFSVYIDDLIKELRQSQQSGHGIHAGTVFVGCILYADDIVLLSGNCYGLQKMMDICSDYGNRFGIRFNNLIPRKVIQLSLEGVLPLILLYS